MRINKKEYKDAFPVLAMVLLPSILKYMTPQKEKKEKKRK